MSNEDKIGLMIDILGLCYRTPVKDEEQDVIIKEIIRWIGNMKSKDWPSLYKINSDIESKILTSDNRGYCLSSDNYSFVFGILQINLNC